MGKMRDKMNSRKKTPALTNYTRLDVCPCVARGNKVLAMPTPTHVDCGLDEYKFDFMNFIINKIVLDQEEDCRKKYKLTW